MFDEKRGAMFEDYHRAREYWIANPDSLIQLEGYVAGLVNGILADNYCEIEEDYNEATYLNAFWANYPPEDRGRAPIGDQIPWIEVGEHAVGHKLSRLISQGYRIREIGLPSGADNRFVLYSEEILRITDGLTDCAFLHLDIKSVGPRDHFDHTVISPYQVSGDGVWKRPEENMRNSTIQAIGRRASHPFYPAISPIYPLTNGDIAPTIHLFVKPVYRMLSLANDQKRGQPLESIQNICVPNGLLLTCRPNYLRMYPGLFFPGKDDQHKDPRKMRARVSFRILEQIAPWRVTEFSN